ncbi:MAG: PepSY domain-containing protein, partial [Planctomycetota bacterium]
GEFVEFPPYSPECYADPSVGVNPDAADDCTEGTVQDFIPFQRVVDAVLAAGDPAFATVDDIDRIDVRPDKRVHKVRSRNGFAEIQVDAVTGEILSQGNVRRSDLIESIHDGSFFGGWMHDWVMPLVSIALLFLIGSGFWLWIEPMVRRARRRRRARNSAT